MDTPDMIREGREKLQGVTEGEWRIPYTQTHLVWGSYEPIAWLNDEGQVEQVEMTPADAAFIVWARNNMKEILNRLEG